MIPYFLLIFISIIFLFVAIRYNSDTKKNTIVYGNTDYIKSNNIAIPVYFVLYFILLSLRDVSIGTDTGAYKRIFMEFAPLSFREIFSMDTDILYGILNWSVIQFTDNFQVLILICSALTVIPVAYVYSKDREHSYLKIILFSTLTPFSMFFSGARQGIAMSVGMIAYMYAKQKKLLPFLLTVLIAIGFHHSAFILLFLYPIYNVDFRKKHLLFLVPAIVIVFIYNEFIFNELTSILSQFSDEYSDATITQTNAFGSLFLFIAFTLFCYIIPDETKMDRDLIGLRNLLIFSVVLQCFAPLHTLSMRLNYYYIIFIPLTISKVITIRRESFKQFALVGCIVLAVYFSYEYFNTLYASYASGVSTFNTIPYKFFWQ